MLADEDSLRGGGGSEGDMVMCGFVFVGCVVLCVSVAPVWGRSDGDYGPELGVKIKNGRVSKEKRKKSIYEQEWNAMQGCVE